MEYFEHDKLHKDIKSYFHEKFDDIYYKSKLLKRSKKTRVTKNSETDFQTKYLKIKKTVFGYPVLFQIIDESFIKVSLDFYLLKKEDKAKIIENVDIENKLLIYTIELYRFQLYDNILLPKIQTFLDENPKCLNLNQKLSDFKQNDIVIQSKIKEIQSNPKISAENLKKISYFKYIIKCLEFYKSDKIPSSIISDLCKNRNIIKSLISDKFLLKKKSKIIFHDSALFDKTIKDQLEIIYKKVKKQDTKSLSKKELSSLTNQLWGALEIIRVNRIPLEARLRMHKFKKKSLYGILSEQGFLNNFIELSDDCKNIILKIHYYNLSNDSSEYIEIDPIIKKMIEPIIKTKIKKIIETVIDDPKIKTKIEQIIETAIDPKIKTEIEQIIETANFLKCKPLLSVLPNSYRNRMNAYRKIKNMNNKPSTSIKQLNITKLKKKLKEIKGK